MPKGSEVIPPELSMKGSSTIEGSLPVKFLREAAPAESAQESARWSTQSDQTVDYYQAGTCNEGDLSKCKICPATYRAPAHQVDVDFRIDSRTGDAAKVYVYVYNVPNPGDEQFNTPGCTSMGGVISPWEGFGPMLVTANVTPSGATAAKVEAAPDSMTGEVLDFLGGSWSIEPLP